ncbi:MAG: hypothetical protein J5833_05420 [Victivallales bacterium]|nr:hypothetical protein [Victivallales bacterium]
MEKSNEFQSQTKEGRDIAEALVKTIKAEDSSRLVTFAGNHTLDDISNVFMDIPIRMDWRRR